MSKVSIIIPVYNAELYLEKCINSAINQTYKDIEIICINDGSTDKSLEILNNFCDDRIKITDIKNHGVGYARNLAISQATGDFIIFLDSDDYIEKTCCEDLVKNQEENNTDLVFCGHYTKTPDGKLCSQWIPTITYSKTPITDRYRITKHLVVTKKLFKTSIIKEHNIQFDITLHYAEDSLFLVQYLSHCGNISGIKKMLYTDVVNPKSLCRNSEFRQRRQIERKRAFEEIAKITTKYDSKRPISIPCRHNKKVKFF